MISGKNNIIIQTPFERFLDQIFSLEKELIQKRKKEQVDVRYYNDASTLIQKVKSLGLGENNLVQIQSDLEKENSFLDANFISEIKKVIEILNIV